MTERKEPKEPRKPKDGAALNLRRLDPRSLRGLAHPLRVQMLDSLRRQGPATASQLAERLGESSGSTSYHLRQLAAHGFVVDDPTRGKGRERWWKSADDGLVLDDTLLNSTDPAVRGAADMLLHELVGQHTREMVAFVGSRNGRPEEWKGASDLSDHTLRLTPELTKELGREIRELIDSYRDLAPAEDDPAAGTVRIHTHILPFDQQ